MTTVVKLGKYDEALGLDATSRAFADYFRSVDPAEYSIAALDRVAYNAARTVPGDSDTFNEILESVEHAFVPAVAEFIAEEVERAAVKSNCSHSYDVREVEKHAKLAREYVFCQRRLAKRATCDVICHLRSFLDNAAGMEPELIEALRRCLFAAALLLTLVSGMTDPDRSEIAGVLDALSGY